MGYFPPHMYDPQINMIRKPFELNKERLRKDFMFPKYENRIKEFFCNFFRIFKKLHKRQILWVYEWYTNWNQFLWMVLSLL